MMLCLAKSICLLSGVHTKCIIFNNLFHSTQKFHMKHYGKMFRNLESIIVSRMIHTSQCAFDKETNSDDAVKDNSFVDTDKVRSSNNNNIKSSVKQRRIYTRSRKDKNQEGNRKSRTVVTFSKEDIENEATEKQSQLWELLCDSQNTSTSGEETSKEKFTTTSKRNIQPPALGDEQDVMSVIKDIIKDIKEQDKEQVKKDLVGRMSSIQNKRSYSFESVKQVTRHNPAVGKRHQDAWSIDNQYNAKAQFDLSRGRRLGIFNRKHDEVQESKRDPDNKMWSSMDWYKYYSELNSQRMNSNIEKHFPWSSYNEMIQWTDQGKLWTFPINNEQDMDEVNVPFYKHIFLEDKLNQGNWCPERGPIRTFMATVINALSLNPYLSVAEKHEHIEWFRDYFTERLETLKNLGLVKRVDVSEQPLDA